MLNTNIKNQVMIMDGGSSSSVQKEKEKSDSLKGNTTKKDTSSKSSSSSNKPSSSGSSSSTTGYEFNIGDKVQIKVGGIDVTNGVVMKTGWKYSQGGPLWGTVKDIINGWKTGSKYGLPATVVKVRIIADDGTIIWQVQPEHVAPQVIRKVSEPEPVTPDPPKPEPTPAAPKKKKKEKVTPTVKQPAETSSSGYFAPTTGSSNWKKGRTSTNTSGIKAASVKTRLALKTKTTSSSMATTKSVKTKANGNVNKAAASLISGNAIKDYEGNYMEDSQATHPENIVSDSVSVTTTKIDKTKWPSMWSDTKKRKTLLGMDTADVQNAYKYPTLLNSGASTNAANTFGKYDYMFIPGDPRYGTGKNSLAKTLEDRLMTLRASIGLPVHGSDQLARSMKMYMYNRFKVPDPNMAYRKSFTHVFFTRPDCNLLTTNSKGEIIACDQALEHTDSVLLWQRYPDLFKMLVDCSRCGDDNNFNMLLSNQVTTFQIGNEGINVVNVGKSWGEHDMAYGETYNGTNGGEFTCTFDDTNDYSIINLMKLWITYIGNVSDGAWSPYYPPDSTNQHVCHVYDRALDYAASVYMFKVAENGEDILYWTKYYGVFPTVTGADALSWVKNGSPDEPPKLTINFRYCWKKDINPMALLTFNQIANVTPDNNAIEYVDIFDEEVAGTSRPFVGAPYIEIKLAPDPILENNDVSRSEKTSIKLKFRKDTSSKRTDSLLFRFNPITSDQSN